MIPKMDNFVASKCTVLKVTAWMTFYLNRREMLVVATRQDLWGHRDPITLVKTKKSFHVRNDNIRKGPPTHVNQALGGNVSFTVLQNELKIFVCA